MAAVVAEEAHPPLPERAASATSVASSCEQRPSKERHDEVAKLLDVPAEEELLDDFICALRHHVLFQGRLYIFTHHACFYSKIFNYEKKLTIPLKNVTQIRKKKHYGFPNAIEITARGRRSFLTNFLKRDAALKLLLHAWNKSSPYAKLFGGVTAQEGDSPSSLGGNGESRRSLYRVKLPKMRSRVHYESSDRASQDGGASPVEAKSPAGGWQGPEGAEMDDVSESDAESETADEGLEAWQPAAEPAPPPPEDMSLLTAAELDLPVRDFFKEFWSDQSQFFVSWHQARGDTKVQLSEWRRHAVGHVRELSFVTPLKQRLGPSQCLCTQTQRIRLHPGERLVFETSQIMDIPYGDHFSVQTRWDVQPCDRGKRCKLEMRLAIPFSKKTIFRSTIEANTRQQMREAAEDWVATARRWLEPPLQVPSAFAGGGSAQGSEGYHSPATHLNRSQSLAMRLSAEHLASDRDLLLRAPTSYRSDIARMLQVQRLEAEHRLASHLSHHNSLRGASLDATVGGGGGWLRQLFFWLGALLLAALLLLLAAGGMLRFHRSFAASFGAALGWLPGLESLPSPSRLLPGWGAQERELALLGAHMQELRVAVAEMRAKLDAVHAGLQTCAPAG